MTRFIEKATAITPNRELQPDEYFNETDHLIYCSKCNTPRQCRHELQGKVLIPSIRCKCQQEIFEQEEAQRKLHEKQMEIKHLKTSGLQDKALYDYTFARDNGINPEIKLAHNYVSNWEEMKANASGLLIWGDVGTGKSFFAGCIANALLEKGVPVLMTNFSRILNTLTGMHFEDRNQNFRYLTPLWSLKRLKKWQHPVPWVLPYFYSSEINSAASSLALFILWIAVLFLSPNAFCTASVLPPS